MVVAIHSWQHHYLRPAIQQFSRYLIFNIFPLPNHPSCCFHVRDYVSIFGCQESSVIHSNANLGVHGQGFLNLSGPGNLIQAQRLILSLFYSVKVRFSSFMYFLLTTFFGTVLQVYEKKSQVRLIQETIIATTYKKPMSSS